MDAEESIYHIKYGITNSATAKVNQNLDKCFLNPLISATTNKSPMQFVDLSLHVGPGGRQNNPGQYYRKY